MLNPKLATLLVLDCSERPALLLPPCPSISSLMNSKINGVCRAEKYKQHYKHVYTFIANLCVSMKETL